MQETLIFHVYLLQAAQINWGKELCLQANVCIRMCWPPPAHSHSHATAAALADILTFLNPLNPPSTSLPTGGRCCSQIFGIYICSASFCTVHCGRFGLAAIFTENRHQTLSGTVREAVAMTMTFCHFPQSSLWDQHRSDKMAILELIWELRFVCAYGQLTLWFWVWLWNLEEHRGMFFLRFSLRGWRQQVNSPLLFL